jgi:oligogalacturonide lyase
LAAFPAVQARRLWGKAQQFPSEIRRYADPLTEREVWRLTGAAVPRHHPYEYQRFLAHNNSFLLLAGGAPSGPGAGPQVLRMDLPSGRMAQLSQGSDVAPYSICLAPDERSFFFLQGGVLKHVGLRTLKEREIYQVEQGWRATGDLGISVDGRYAALVEMRSSDWVEGPDGEERLRLQFERKPLCRIRIIETAKGNHSIVTEEKNWLGRPQLRPKRDQVLYCQLGPSDRIMARMWLVNLDGKQKQSLRPKRGEEQLGPEYWTGDGKQIEYAHYVDQNWHKPAVRTLNPDTREEQEVARCTQFWHLRGNADNSAIVGESRSKAGPNIYVLFPEVQREMTICEHASSGKPDAQPRPVFSPDSQWIYFTSDRGGVQSLYRANVADLVEKT